MSPGCLQSHFTPQVLGWIEIRRLGGPFQRGDVVLAPPVGDEFGTMSWRIVIMEQEVVRDQLPRWQRYAYAFLLYPDVLVALTVPSTM